MDKIELIVVVAEKAELSKKNVEKAVKAFTDTISEELVKGGRVQLVDFETLETSERATREKRNPKAGKTMIIETSKTPKLKAGKALRGEVNK